MTPTRSSPRPSWASKVSSRKAARTAAGTAPGTDLDATATTSASSPTRSIGLAVRAARPSSVRKRSGSTPRASSPSQNSSSEETAPPGSGIPEETEEPDDADQRIGEREHRRRARDQVAQREPPDLRDGASEMAVEAVQPVQHADAQRDHGDPSPRILPGDHREGRRQDDERGHDHRRPHR